MQLRIGSGSASGGLGLVGSGLSWAFPDQRWIGVVLILLGSVVLMFDVRVEHGRIGYGGNKAKEILFSPIRAWGAKNWAAWVIVLVILSPFVYVMATMFPKVEPERLHFAIRNISVSGAMNETGWVLDRQHQTGFYAVPNVSTAFTRDRIIQMIVFVEVHNATPNPITVARLSVSTSNSRSGPWTELCPVDLAGSQFVMSPDGHSGILLGSDNFLDYTLVDKILPGYADVSGWSAWECPGVCGTKYLRFGVVDTDDTVFSNVAEAPGGQNGRSIENGAPIHVTPTKVQLETRPPAFEPGCG